MRRRTAARRGAWSPRCRRNSACPRPAGSPMSPGIPPAASTTPTRWGRARSSWRPGRAGSSPRPSPPPEGPPRGAELRRRLLAQRLAMQALVLPEVVELHAPGIVDGVRLEALADLLVRRRAFTGVGAERRGLGAAGRRRGLRLHGDRLQRGGLHEPWEELPEQAGIGIDVRAHELAVHGADDPH